MTGMAAVSEPDFSADAEAQPDAEAVRVRMTGNADLRVKTQLDEFLERLHVGATSAGAKEVVVDLRSLEFMNSTCFKSLLTWIGRIQSMPEEKRYRVRLISSPEMYWQRRSLHALSCFATDLISVEE